MILKEARGVGGIEWEREQSLTKYEWYRKVDPHNHAEAEYRHLAEIPGARHAPVLLAWNHGWTEQGG